MSRDIIITTNEEKMMFNRIMIFKIDCFLAEEEFNKRVEMVKKEFNSGFIALGPTEKALIITETGEIKCID